MCNSSCSFKLTSHLAKSLNLELHNTAIIQKNMTDVPSASVPGFLLKRVVVAP